MKKILSLILAALILLTITPMAYAQEDVKKVGDVIEFGQYPQMQVQDEALVNALNARAPAWENWISYGHYSGEGIYGTMTSGDWMRYTEVTYNGSRYRGVRFTQCRTSFTYTATESSYTENGYRTYTNYWFKYEPLKWRVLDPSTGLVMCETIIDSQPYSNTVYYDEKAASDSYAYFNDASYKNYANDYETSSIRKWLNEDFCDAAFSAGEKNEILATELNNDGYYTLNGYTDYKALDSKATNDKVFLLSYDEMLNVSYGFNEVCNIADSARMAKGSDYAKCQGLSVGDSYYEGNSYWLLRTAGNKSSSACYVNIDGYVYYTYSVNHTVFGVRPAMCLSSVVHEHNYSAAVTAPTCLDGGFTTYSCVCGHSYIDGYTEAVGHKDDNADNKCDFNCGYVFESSDSGDSGESEKPKSNIFERIAAWIRSFLKSLFGWIKF